MQLGSIYECEIWHERTSPRSHSFKSRHFMFYLPLDDLQPACAKLHLLGINRANFFALYESDYLPDDTDRLLPLLQRVKSKARELGVQDRITRVELLTNVRVFGYVFNPVSFYFCFREDQHPICCICEVGNTFGEKKVYLVSPDIQGRLRARHKKFFYVSPFTELNSEFRFEIDIPDKTLNIRVDTVDGGEKIVQAAMTGRRVALNDSVLARMMFCYPWATAKVIALIHLHAFILWCKGVPFHRKEEGLDRQLDILNAKRVKASRLSSQGDKR